MMLIQIDDYSFCDGPSVQTPGGLDRTVKISANGAEVFIPVQKFRALVAAYCGIADAAKRGVLG